MLQPAQNWLLVSSQQQRMYLCSPTGERLNSWLIATGKAGMGEQEGSGRTPRGWHRIRAALGQDANPLAVFVARRPTGELWSAELEQAQPNRDWILGRILWLVGEETGRNRGGQHDTQRRFIYIHGVPPSRPLGTPASQGCINLHPQDLLEVFALAPVGTKVFIE